MVETTLAADVAPPLGAHQLQVLLLQLGPSVLGQAAPGLVEWLLPSGVDQAHLLDAVSQLGVLLLVGVTGAHLDARMMRRRTGTVARVGAAALLLPFGLGIATGYLVPRILLEDRADRTTFAVFLGVAMAVSAIPVIAKTLADMNLLHRDVGQLTLAVATVDDAFAWLLLSVIPALAVGGFIAVPLATSVLYLLGFVAVAALIGRPLVRAAMRRAGRAADDGASAATVVVIILLGAAGSHALGLEAVFGAFVAGVLVGAPGVADPARLAPLRTVVLSVLAPIFLAGAGLRVDLTALASPVVLLAGLAILLVAMLGKFAGAYAGARMSRLGHWEGVALGAGLNARGVVEIVVAMVGLRLGILSTAMYTIVVLVAVVTSVVAPPILRVAMARLEQSAEENMREASLAGWTRRPMAPAGEG